MTAPRDLDPIRRLRRAVSARLRSPVDAATDQMMGAVEQLRTRLSLGNRPMPLQSFLEQAQGGITPEEGQALRRHAASTPAGCGVEVGSFRGKSAVALADGLARARPGEPAERPLFCVEPHEPFVGVNGGRFGPEDRAAFYQAMLKTGAFTNARLVNLSSREAAAGWHRPVGILFIDGDHRYQAVREDYELWAPHVLAGGIIALDDSHRPELGPARLVRELLPNRELELIERVNKITFLRKIGPYLPPDRDRLDILVICHQYKSAGGLLRFERTARRLPQDRVAFVHLAPTPGRRAIELELLSFEEAASLRWDVTMVPGQAFPEETVARLSSFVDPRFGQRIQHVLNDAHRKEGFIAVNRAFRPHGVLFNNRHWATDDVTAFHGHRFRVLEGAVDVHALSSSAARPSTSDAPRARTIGGVDRPRLRGFWSQLAPRLPEGWRLQLMGPTPAEPIPGVSYAEVTNDEELAGFFESCAAVFSPELHAGWANVVAEAMVAGVPVVCSEAGTLALARPGQTAIVAPPTAIEPWLHALDWLQTQPEEAQAMADRAREHARAFDWGSYAAELRAFVQDDGRSHYSAAPEMGLLGKWPLSDRLHGLEPLWAEVRGASVLDLGCAEGIAAQACIEHGAHAVHGFELEPSRIAAALRLNPEPLALFRAASVSPWAAFERQPHLRPAYELVLHLGLHHHLPPTERMDVLAGALARCRRIFAIRTPAALWNAEGLDAFIRARGFELVSERDPELRTEGRLGVYRRIREDAKLARRDLRLVSFPKSGRTWLRYALTQLGLADAVRFEHDGFEYNDGAKPPLDFDEAKRWLKCHRADRVVYLHRDPRDVMVSLYHQVTGRFRDFFRYEGDISTFIRDPYFGAENLADFQRMWKRVIDEGLAVSFSYADAHRDFEGTLRRVVDAFGLEATDDAIRVAGERSRFERMQRVEAEGGFDAPWLRMRNGAPKVRRGQEGAYQQELSSEDRAYLDEIFAELI